MPAGTKSRRSPTNLAAFGALLEYCIDPVFILDATDARILAANQPASKSFGYAVADLAGMALTDLVPGSQAESVRFALSNTSRASGTGLDVKLAILDIGGCEIPCTARIWEDVSGCLVVTMRERTDASDTDASNGNGNTDIEPGDDDEPARDEDNRFQTLADSVPVGIYFADAQGKFLYVNSRWSAISGMNLMAAAGEGWLRHVHADDQDRVASAWYTAVTTNREFGAEYRFVVDGGVRWVLGRASAYRKLSGEKVGFLGTVLDITDRREAEERLKESEERYRHIFENVLDVYYETDLEGTIIEVGPSIKRFSGFTREQVIGRSMLEFYTNSDERGRLLQTLAEKGAVNDYEITLRRKSGERAHCAITAKLILDVEGMPKKIVGSLRDITERKQTEKLLAEERLILENIVRDLPLEEVLSTLLESIEDQAPDTVGSIFLVDSTGEVLSQCISPNLPAAYREAVGTVPVADGAGCCGTAAYRRAEVITEDIESDPVWGDLRSEAIKHGLRACWSSPIISSTDKLLGTFALYCRAPGQPSTLHRQIVQATINLAKIAIERKQAESERERLEADIRRAQKLESLGVLAGGIAHDFNNLLTGVMGYASLAKRILMKEESRAIKHVGEIEKVAQRAAHLTNQMLAYSGKGKFIIQQLDLGEIVSDLAHLLQASISKKAEITYDFAKGTPPIEADITQVQQVVMNLIINASDALEDKSGKITVSTGVVAASEDYLADSMSDRQLPEGLYAYAEVTDTGCGMDTETLQKIFDPFFTTKFTGRGLGLSAVLGIMRGHKGTIRIRTAPGEGTTMRVLFPCVSGNANRCDAAPGRDKFTSVSAESTGGLILVVDDEETIRDLASGILGQAGYDVLTAIDGQEGVETFEEHAGEITAVLLDLTMPKLDGVEAYQKIRELREDVPVVFTSGYSAEQVTERLGDSALAGFVQKPFSEEALVAAFAELVSR